MKAAQLAAQVNAVYASILDLDGKYPVEGHMVGLHLVLEYADLRQEFGVRQLGGGKDMACAVLRWHSPHIAEQDDQPCCRALGYRYQGLHFTM